MDLLEFRHLLAAFGGDLATWPAAEAEAALELISSSPAAQDLFARTAAEELKAGDGPEPDAGPLADRIAAAIRPKP